MMNGKGANETLSNAVSLNDKLDGEDLAWKLSNLQFLDKNKDVSPVSSRYSSCGESEFDRYCSANSVMGTPSLCGSVGTFHDFNDSDFGSVKSPRVGDVSGLESFSLGGKFEKNKNLLALGKLGEYGHRSESCDVMSGLKNRNKMTMENEMHSYDEMEDLPDEGGVIMWKDNISSKRMPSTSTDKIPSPEAMDEPMENVEVEKGFENNGGRPMDVHSKSEGETSSHLEQSESEGSMYGYGIDNEKPSGMEEHIENVELEKGSENNGGRPMDEQSEGKTSSHLEHSESEGSMYGDGTDNEEPSGHINYSQERKSSNENTLRMSSSVAYGSDDWNDFMQETMETPQDLFLKDKILTSKSTFVGTTLDSSQKQETMEAPQDLFLTDEIQGHNQNEIPTSKSTFVGTTLDSSQIQETMEAPQDLFVTDEIQGHNQNEIPTSTSTFVGTTIDSSEKQEHVKDFHTDFLKTHSISHIDFLKHEEDMVAIGKQAEDFNQLKMEEVFQVEENPLKNVLTRQHEHTNSSETTDNHTQDDSNFINHTLKAENYELNEFYDEVVYEMEEILLDSGESPAARFTRGRNHHHHHNSQVSLPSRDGGSTASTSSIENSHSTIQNPYKIDGIEVIGARQKKGDVSLGERLVGVKEYTVYKLRVWSGTHQWEVERRYRDFFTLYRRLKTSFANKGWDLPTPWSIVDQESRKFFGNASPDVVSERSVLIQECLQSVLHSNLSSSLPSSIIWFLSPPNANTHISRSPLLGQSISLIVELRPHKSVKQMLEAQHYTCAGCHKYFDDGKTRLWEFVQTLGWGKPRVCEYSGQVFCSSCHVNETAILPARVLHWWDFTEYPVSQLAKSYLDSTHDKPMLCVSAVNPFLFSKVPPLQHVVNVRKRIGRMLPYVRCPFRKNIYKGVGSRRYLLETTDFFALKDLVDLSKGIFAALPVMVETISKKIVDHITDECLICYDVGVPCGARQACDDPSSLIFPFQEGEVERCKSCELLYHKPCFKKMVTCPCGVNLGTRSMRSSNVSSTNVSSNNLMQDTESKSPMGFLSGLISKATSSKLWGTKQNDTVILMGSLPTSSP